MSQSNGRPLSRIQKALHEQIPGERERDIYRDVAIHGRFVDEVAKERNLTKAQANAAVRRVQRWLAQARMAIDLRQLQALHLQRLEHQWHEVMTAWYRSAKPEETVKASYEDQKAKSAAAAKTEPTSKAVATKKTPSKSSRTAKPARGDDGKRKIERTTREPCGDVRYLEQARKIMSEVRSLTTEALAARQKEERDVEELTAAQKEQEAARRIAEIREGSREAED